MFELVHLVTSVDDFVFTVISNNGEEVQYRCFNQVHDEKNVSQPDTIALLGNNYSLQIK